jgi:hypothetical protein
MSRVASQRGALTDLSAADTAAVPKRHKKACLTANSTQKYFWKCLGAFPM